MSGSKSSADIDSLRPLICRIDSAVEISGHTEYAVRFIIPHIESATWVVNKRYSDFVALHSSLAPYGSGSLPELPAKKTFGNKEREFVAERQQALQIYLGLILENIFLSASREIKEFIHTGPRIADTAGSALQLLSMVFRTNDQFGITESLPAIGWRVNKAFVGVKCTGEPKLRLIGCWTFYGHDRALHSSEISNLLECFSQIKHPLFTPLTFADARDVGYVIVRARLSSGSLWDVIRSNSFSQSFLSKNAKSKAGKPFSVSDIQKFGRQILECLKFLHDSGIPYGNLSSRNLFIDKSGVHLTDSESGVCGLRSFYWPFLLQLRKINTFEAIDIYCFGHVLYEMVFGKSCETPTCTVISPDCPPLVRAVLESILTPEAVRGGMPTVSQLLTQPLFNNVVLNSEPVSMKISRKLKDALASAKEKMETRIVNEQKLYHTYVKNQTAYSVQSSEEEKKKRRMQALKSQISGAEVNVVDARAPTPTSTVLNASVLAAASTVAPPPPPPPPPPTALIPPPSGPPGNIASPMSSPSAQNGALLASIRTFKKDSLAASTTIDKSGPNIQ